MNDDLERLLSVATPEEIAEAERLLNQPKIQLPFCPHDPGKNKKQVRFIGLSDFKEVFYGGAAGGGKSDALLMAFLQYADQPNYAGLILRRTEPELTMAGGLIQRCHEWFDATEVRWNGKTRTWTFPSGATLRLGTMQLEDDKLNYKSSEFQYIAFDELTSFTETQYRYMFSRLRRLVGSEIPLRMRSASNPGDVGHDWVKRRFVAPKIKIPSSCFVPARLEDNPELDYETYVASLAYLDPITRKQLLAGDWDAYEGGRFQKTWFRHTFRQSDISYFLKLANGNEEEVAKNRCGHYTICDPAATAEDSSDPTAIIAFAVTPRKKLLVLDVVRDWIALEDIVPRVRDVALRNNSDYVGFEAVAFQWAMVHLGRRMENMPPVRALSASVAKINLQKGQKGKLVRATPAIVKAEAGEIYLPTYGAWLEDFVAELVLFTGDDKKDAYDDQVDCLAYGVLQVNFAMAVQEKDPLAKPPPERPSGYPSQRLVPRRHSNASRRKMFGL